MRDSIYLLIGAVIAAAVAIIGCGGNDAATPGEFTADIVIKQGGVSMDGSFFAKGSRYRIEINSGKGEVIVIVDESDDQTILLTSAEKSYRRMACSSMTSRMNDPFQGLRYAAISGESQVQGVENFNGYDCQKIVISKGTQELLTQWRSSRLSFPIKIVDHSAAEKYMELSNIVETAVDDSLFAIPSGYTDSDRPTDQGDLPEAPIPPETWKSRTAQAPAKEPAKRGEELRITVNPDKKVNIRFKNMSQKGHSECQVAFYQSGVEIGSDLVGSVGYRTVVLQKLGLATNNTWDAPADEVVIRVLKGIMLLEVKEL